MLPTRWPKHQPLPLSFRVGYSLMKGPATQHTWMVASHKAGALCCSDHGHEAMHITVLAFKKDLVFESTT